jgi:RNA polymerase primary sigma factor
VAPTVDHVSSSSAGKTATPLRAASGLSREAVRERKLLRAARRGDRGARERLVVSRLRLVRGVASRYRNLGLPFDDLVQEGALGLLEAIDRYDPCRGVAFDAYARFRVRRAIRNALTDKARLVRLPKQIVERQRALARTEAKFASEHGRPPTVSELATVTGLSENTVSEARAVAVKLLSLDEALLDEGGTLASAVPDPTAPNPELEVLAEEQNRLVRDAVARLPSTQRFVVSRRFGLDSHPAPVAELAANLHLSERRTRTIERDGLHTLARQLLTAAGTGEAAVYNHETKQRGEHRDCH